MHGCPCPAHQGLTPHEKKRALNNKPCPMNGRRAIELAAGKCDELLSHLKQLMPQRHPKASSALAELERLDKDSAQAVARSFAAAKSAMLFRFEQGTSFYSQFPWSMPKLVRYILVPAESRNQAVHESREFARQLLELHRSDRLDKTTFAAMFFEPPLMDSLTAWASDRSDTMDQGLFKELLYYGLSLVAMQRLEAKHHLVHQKAGLARAGTSAYHSANLRRRLNGDVHQVSFREHFTRFLGKFSELVPEPWTSKCELARLVAGHHLSIMFNDTSFEDALVAAAAPSSRTRVENALIFQEHVKANLKPGHHYAVPTRVSPCGSTTYCIFQVVDPKPAGKKYMQRTVGWSQDIWHDHVGVLLLGTHEVPQGSGLIDLDLEEEPAPLCDDFCFIASASDVDAFPLCAFFKYNFDNIYELTNVVHTCEVSMDAITAVMAEESSQDIIDSHVL